MVTERFSVKEILKKADEKFSRKTNLFCETFSWLPVGTFRHKKFFYLRYVPSGSS